MKEIDAIQTDTIGRREKAFFLANFKARCFC